MPPRTKPLKVLHISPKELHRFLQIEARSKKMVKIIQGYMIDHAVGQFRKRTAEDCPCWNCAQARAIPEVMEGLLK